MLQYSIPIAAAILVFCAYFVWIRPLRALSEAIARVRGGDFSAAPIRVRGTSEMREIARSFNATIERLKALEQTKSDFLTLISHEIRNPLAALKEGLNLLSAEGERLTPEARTKGFKACLIASKRLEAMISNLLNAAHGRGDFFETGMDVRDLRSAIQTAIDETRPMAEKRGMNFQFEPDPKLEMPFSFSGIVHVCENLFQNAIKYGEPQSSIRVRAQRQDNHAVITVENLGKGIAPSELPRIFERFYRGSNSSRETGLGVGLHVVKRIIESHQGEIQAHSASGRTSFEIRLPEVQAR